MKIFNNIGLIDLAIYTNGTLIVTDFHIGYEEALNKQGLMVPRFQFPEIIKRLDNIFKKLKTKKIERIIVNGDIKHEFSTISDQEWRHTLKLFDYFGQYCKEIILIKGNHDAILGPIAKKRNVKVVEHYLISTINKKTIKKIKINNRIEKTIKKLKIINKKELKNKILVMHGDKIPDKDLLKKSKIIIIGHEHPAVSIREGPRTELFKAYLTGKWKGKNLIVQPSFNLVTEGTDVIKEELLSPFLQQNLRNFDVIVVADKMYRFGKLKELS
jgi:hypothetical protein|tara:strand:+ start:2384 stop:3196 length:813 start_codon:yes stop_codon:yes gene_type:complete